MAVNNQAKELRQALRDSLPPVDHAGKEPERSPAFTYVPPSHARALDPDTCIVEGIRGSGKSFWWAHLSSKPHQKFITGAFPEAKISSQVTAVQAFGAQSNSVDSPSQDVLAALIEKKYNSRIIWRAVCAHKLGFGGAFPAKGNWQKRVDWVAKHPEEFDELLLDADSKLNAKNQTIVILFDALDRLADDWANIRPLVKGLFQVAQDLRSTRRIRFKIFVRPDMLQDKAIIGFPDASKLLARKAWLTWRRADLYALLFQCMGNAPKGGKVFRTFTSELGLDWQKDGQAWVLPSALRTDERLQEEVFIVLAGRAMASGATGIKRGKPYTWLVNHLQDGLDQVSPRSFFAALRHAAEQTHDDNALAIGYREIQQGVQTASQIRVDEITGEDYPWVNLVMHPLRGQLSVPCTVADVSNIWNNEKTLSELKKNLKASGTSVKLPPQSLEEGVEGVLKDLGALGLVNRLKDQRIQMPDVYRIAFGLGRRGGVKPLK